MNELDHLAPTVREMAGQSNRSRLRFIAEDRWIDYPQARKTLDKLETLLHAPIRTRMPGLLIYGDSNIGKSMIIQKFLRAHPPGSFNSKTGRVSIDVLSIEMPATPQERRLYGQLLMALNAPYRPGDRLPTVELTALTLLDELTPPMLIVDEIHNLLAGTAREQRAALNLLKFLSNRLHCAIVTLGTRDALAAMHSDSQIASRFPGAELPRWQQNDELRSFIAGFERQLPLQLPSNIANSPPMVRSIMNFSGGLTGRITDLLSQAARAAIVAKHERITVGLLESLKT
ncbi:MAG: TniB family NTP-binding protein [Burkholderiaceae bacterium]